MKGMHFMNSNFSNSAYRHCLFKSLPLLFVLFHLLFTFLLYTYQKMMDILSPSFTNGHKYMGKSNVTTATTPAEGIARKWLGDADLLMPKRFKTNSSSICFRSPFTKTIYG
jgi:hypothetical protein